MLSLKKLQSKQYIKSFISSLMFLLFVSLQTGCHDSESVDLSNTTITAVDGYIKNAILKDANGVTARYIENGRYQFDQKPLYPLYLVGGVIEDINLSFDLNLTLSDENISVISPITTFISDDVTLLNIFNALIISDNIFKDYVDTNDTALAKVSQLLYLVLQDESFKSSYTNMLKNSSVNTIEDLFSVANQTLDMLDINPSKRLNLLLMLSAIKDIDTTIVNVRDIEKSLEFYKILSTYKYKDADFLSSISTGQNISFLDFDDGFYQKGIKRDYIYDEQNDIVYDNTTKLMWQDSNDTISSKKSWSDAVLYCKELTLGGYDDWRLPSIEELVSITDKSRYNPSIGEEFKSIVSDFYWSSTQTYSYPSHAWAVSFLDGSVSSIEDVETKYYIRCVRASR